MRISDKSHSCAFVIKIFVRISDNAIYAHSCEKTIFPMKRMRNNRQQLMPTISNNSTIGSTLFTTDCTD